MAATSQSGGEPITSRAQLVEYLEGGCKPKDQWRIGTEHEKFAFYFRNNKPVPFEGNNGIEALLLSLKKFGWESILEDKKTIA